MPKPHPGQRASNQSPTPRRTRPKRLNLKRTSPRQPARYRVEDFGVLKSFLDYIVDRAGGPSAAADKMDIGRSHLDKLRRGKIRALTEATVVALEKLLPRARRSELRDRALLPPIGRYALRKYDLWRVANLARGGALDGPRPGSGDFVSARTPRELVQALKADSIYSSYFNAFEKKVARKWPDVPDTKQRLLLAECQAVAPLVAHWRTAAVERSVAEMEKARHLGPFLSHALGAMSLLLSREPATMRARGFSVSATFSPSISWLGYVASGG